MFRAHQSKPDPYINGWAKCGACGKTSVVMTDPAAVTHWLLSHPCRNRKRYKNRKKGKRG